MRSKRGSGVFGIAAALAGVFIALCGDIAVAQTSTGSIRGYVRDESGAPVAGATISARNVDAGTERTAVTGDGGFYNLAGLRPDRYSLTARRIGFGAQGDTITLLIGQTLVRDFRMTAANVQLESVVIVAEATGGNETRTSEVATNITREQIENLPQADRNFLNFALQAPGTRLDRNGNLAADAQSANNVNVFIDGATYKSDILPGGVVGQDPGNRQPAFNPFPQSAVQEFRVITQNFKAEYQKASSAIITATTRSGTNRWEGNAYIYEQPERFVARNFFETQDNRPAPDINRRQIGISGGGPLIEDRLHFFGAFEMNDQDNALTVRLNRREGAPDFLLEREGTFSAPLNSKLYFGKLNYQAGPRHAFELSATTRNEYDTRGFGGTRSAEGAEKLNNDVTTGILKYQFAGDRFVNEAQITGQRYRYNPVALQSGIVQEFVDFATIGPKDSEQDLLQDRIALRNDLTTTVAGFGGTHVLKGGANIDFVKYDVHKTIFGNPKFFYFGQFETPAFAFFGIGDPQLEADNQQFGLYVQDDWSIGERLELNLGVRWDYETNAFNNEHVTPDSIRTLVGSFVDQDRYFTDGNDREPFKGSWQPRLGFSYDVFADARTTIFGGAGLYYDRNVFNNVLDERYRLQYVQYTFEFQEREGDGRIPFEPQYLSAEGLRALQASGRAGRPEIFLNANDTKPPRSLQTSFGVRQALGDFLITASYGGVRGYNQFVYIPARNATGGIISGPAFDKILLSSDAAKTWFDALYLKFEKPFIAGSKWGAQINYTLSKAETDGTDEGQGNFNFDVQDERSFRRHPTQGDERHRINANWITTLNYGVLFSGAVTLGSGTPFNVVTGCMRTQAEVEAVRNTPVSEGGNPTFEQFCVDRGFYGNGNFTGEDDFAPGTERNSGRPPQQSFIFGRWAYRNVDLRLAKNFRIGGREIGIVGEAFNAFGFDNLRYNTRNLRFDQVRPPVDFGSGDRTRYQLGATLKL